MRSNYSEGHDPLIHERWPCQGVLFEMRNLCAMSSNFIISKTHFKYSFLSSCFSLSQKRIVSNRVFFLLVFHHLKNTLFPIECFFLLVLDRRSIFIECKFRGAKRDARDRGGHTQGRGRRKRGSSLRKRERERSG